MILDFSVGGMSDSYYEYLLKFYIQSGKTDQLHLKLLEAALEVNMPHNRAY